MQALQILLFALITSFLGSSCQMDDITCVRVDGPIETQKRTLSDFNEIFFSDVGNLHISQGNEYSFIAKGQRVILDYLKTSVNDNELVIRLDNCFNGDTYSFDVFITAPEIKRIEMAGVGEVTTETMLSADIFTFVMSGVSETNTLKIQADSISTYHLGQGDIEITGNTRSQYILSSGQGNIYAQEFSSENTTITSNGVGDIYVNATAMLHAILNNVGNVYYTGSPEVIQEGNGIGEVIDNN